MSTMPHSLEPVHFSPQTIYCGDCLEILAHFPANCADLVYIDPPFNSNRNYEVFWGDTAEKRAFDDRYGDAMAYCNYMRPRIEQLHRVLKTTGSFYYHCDWHASHYIKVMLDEIFGANQFRNEIIWKRSSAHSDTKQGRRQYGSIHDSIFFYSKGSDSIWNVQYVPYDEEYLDSFYRHVEEDTGRRFRLSDLTANKGGGDTSYEWHGVLPFKGRYWAYSKANMEEFETAGRLYYAKTGMPYYKRYLDEMPGVPLQTIWTDLKPIGASAKERLGYPTQKPLALLERIIKASSNEGDIVLDAFCGCGTTLVAAQQLKRKFVGIDISPSSCNVMGQRLEQVCGLRQAPASMSAADVAASWDAEVTKKGVAVKDGARQAYYAFSNLPRSAEQLRALPGFEFENWAVLQLGEVLKHHGRKISAQVNRAKVGDFGLDGKIYLVTNTSIKREGKRLFGGAEDYIPIQVKNKDKAGRPDMDNFASALRRDERSVGFFIAWDFTRDALTEIERLKKPGGKEENQPLVIIPVPVQTLIAETFDSEVLALLGA